MSDPKLSVYATECDWWVAASVAEVEEMYLKRYGDTVQAMCDEIELLPDDRVLKIMCDEDGQISDSGEAIPRMAAEWAIREGRGLLASTEL